MTYPKLTKAIAWLTVNKRADEESTSDNNSDLEDIEIISDSSNETPPVFEHEESNDDQEIYV